VHVRSTAEYQQGRIKNEHSFEWYQSTFQLNKDTVIITCCAFRNEVSAKSILKKSSKLHFNGGGWSSLQNKL
jgi:head-tail adaptor